MGASARTRVAIVAVIAACTVSAIPAHAIASTGWSQQAKVAASDPALVSQLGDALATNGTTTVVGAAETTVGENSSQGAAFVFAKTNSGWKQTAELTAADGARFDYFGESVALSGTTLVVGSFGHQVNGAPSGGAVYVYEHAITGWALTTELTSPDDPDGAGLGGAVAISGATIVVGVAQRGSGRKALPGAVYVFSKRASGWEQTAELTAANGAKGAHFATSVAIDGPTLVVGADLAGSIRHHFMQGAAYVFTKTGPKWQQAAELVDPHGAPGDEFGYSVAVNGSTAVIGAPCFLGASDPCPGSASVYLHAPTGWPLAAKLVASDGADADQFGEAVAVLPATVLVGAYRHQVGDNLRQGAVYGFADTIGGWSQTDELTATDGVANDEFGYSVAVSGSTAAFGAPYAQVGDTQEAGAAYIFTRSPQFRVGRTRPPTPIPSG